MISALAWIPRGAAKLEPQYTVIDEHDEDAIQAMAELQDVDEVSCLESRLRLMH